MAQYFMDSTLLGLKNMGDRIKVFDNLIDARRYAIQYLTTKNRLVEKEWENYHKYGGKMPATAVYGARINTIKNGIVSGCGYVQKSYTNSGKVKFEWKSFSKRSENGITINPNGTLRKIAKKKAHPFGL